TACAWLPDENATTPFFFSSSVIEKTKLAAPRILNAPPVWKFSHLKNASTPEAALNPREVNTGVLRAIGAIRAAACWISANVMSVPGMVVHDVLERLALDEAVDVFHEPFHRAFDPARRAIGVVRRDQHVVEVPERRVLGEGLDLEDVEHGGANLFCR